MSRPPHRRPGPDSPTPRGPRARTLCPTRDPARPSEIPDRDYDVAVFANRFPSLAPLTVERAVLDASRARVGSYRHRLCVIEPDRDELPADLLRNAVRAGLADAAEHLSSPSDSFGLPAWRKWSRLLVDPRAAKGWPTVFADGRGVLRALASVWEGIEPAGMAGGHLRDVFADGLEQAAAVLDEPDLAGEAQSLQA